MSLTHATFQMPAGLSSLSFSLAMALPQTIGQHLPVLWPLFLSSIAASSIGSLADPVIYMIMFPIFRTTSCNLIKKFLSIVLCSCKKKCCSSSGEWNETAGAAHGTETPHIVHSINGKREQSNPAEDTKFPPAFSSNAHTGSSSCESHLK